MLKVKDVLVKLHIISRVTHNINQTDTHIHIDGQSPVVSGKIVASLRVLLW